MQAEKRNGKLTGRWVVRVKRKGMLKPYTRTFDTKKEAKRMEGFVRCFGQEPPADPEEANRLFVETMRRPHIEALRRLGMKI
jgi:hypothetical protein